MIPFGARITSEGQLGVKSDYYCIKDIPEDQYCLIKCQYYACVSLYANPCEHQECNTNRKGLLCTECYCNYSLHIYHIQNANNICVELYIKLSYYALCVHVLAVNTCIFILSGILYIIHTCMYHESQIH